MILRPYQETAFNIIWQTLQTEYNVLLEAACGAGKTILFAKIAQRLLAENPSFRVLFLMDREILVRQTEEKLKAVAPELTLDIGIVCASASKIRTEDRRVTIASRQSLVNGLLNFIAPQLTVVDECHMMAVPKKDEQDQFGKIISALRNYNPNMRMLGVTATPYRLNDGYIYGKRNAPKLNPYFDDVHYRIKVAELLELGFLAPLLGKTVTPQSFEQRLESIGLVGGEYNAGQTAALMSETMYVDGVINAYKDHAINRKKAIVFCVTIEHAKKVTQAFNDASILALELHSELDNLDSYTAWNEIKKVDNSIKVFVSVAMLTTGLDVVDVDCIIMARPTKSTALYKQILGRGMRTAPGKTDCLVLDLVGNNHRFGTDLDKLIVEYKRGFGKGESKKPTEKECLQCGAILHPAVRICPECGFSFMAEFSGETPELQDVEYGVLPPKEYQVSSLFSCVHKSKKTGFNILRIMINLDNGDMTKSLTVNQWVCFAADGYEGFAVTKGRQTWELFTGEPMPLTAREAAEIHLVTPSMAIVDESGKYPEVKKLIFEEVPF